MTSLRKWKKLLYFQITMISWNSDIILVYRKTLGKCYAMEINFDA